MADHTASDVFRHRRGGRPAGDRRPVLRVLLLAGRPFDPPSRHLLDDVDLIELGRGPRAAVRERADGLSRLALLIPDPVMSTEYGRLVRAHGQWLLDDPARRMAPSSPASLPAAPRCAWATSSNSATRCSPSTRSSRPPARRLICSRPTWRRRAPSSSPSIRAWAQELDRVSRVAASGQDVPVLVLGKSGTGKEVLARAVHQLSGRGGAFVAVNCGGLVPAPIEAELFGARKGSFTGATADRAGYLQAADGGTLFLDELGDLPPPAQIALLRALQEHAVVRSAPRPRSPSTSASVPRPHRDLPQMVEAGTFREDLYARLLGVAVTLPPLRERKADLGLLVARILGRLPHGDRARFAPADAYASYRYHWHVRSPRSSPPPRVHRPSSRAQCTTPSRTLNLLVLLL